MKLAKNQAKSKQHPVAELLLFETCLLSLSTLSSKNNSNIFWKMYENWVRLFKRGDMINSTENKTGNEK